MSSITLRTAADDLSLLQYWDTQTHVIASDPNDHWGWETELQHPVAWCEQLIAEVEGRPDRLYSDHRSCLRRNPLLG